jgi:hypothetical protein
LSKESGKVVNYNKDVCSDTNKYLTFCTPPRIETIKQRNERLKKQWQQEIEEFQQQQKEEQKQKSILEKNNQLTLKENAKEYEHQTNILKQITENEIKSNIDKYCKIISKLFDITKKSITAGEQYLTKIEEKTKNEQNNKLRTKLIQKQINIETDLEQLQDCEDFIERKKTEADNKYKLFQQIYPMFMSQLTLSVAQQQQLPTTFVKNKEKYEQLVNQLKSDKSKITSSFQIMNDLQNEIKQLHDEVIAEDVISKIQTVLNLQILGDNLDQNQNYKELLNLINNN